MPITTSKALPGANPPPIPAKKTSWKTLIEEKWRNLRPDLAFYMDYHKKHITHFHYSFKVDRLNWLHTEFLDLAVNNEALLFAVVGFAAYHYTLQNPTGKIQDFLKYYNASVTALRESLQRNLRPTVTTMLTILQLASIEVCWRRVVGFSEDCLTYS